MELRQLLGFGLAVSALALAAVGCSSDDEEHGNGDGGHGHELSPECQAIVDACHEVDMGDPGPINDCHAAAHDNDQTHCVDNGASCIALCEAAGMDGGAHDAGSD